MNELLDDPFDRCFLCEPEPWRRIYEGKGVRIVAGVGPLCPGYVMLSPKEHIATAASLSHDLLVEFLAVFEILKRGLAAQFGIGYTAYEHGRIGGCKIDAHRTGGQSFCHHSHRVVIPRYSQVRDEITRWFDEEIPLPDPEDIARLRDDPYIFYEAWDPRAGLTRTAFRGDRGIGPQFMRRTLTAALATGRDSSWAGEPNLPEVIETTAALRGELLGLEPWDPSPDQSAMRLPRSVTIDGPSGAGKTTLARMLAARSGCRMIDSGLVFRMLARAAATGIAVDEAALDDACLAAEPDRTLFDAAVTAQAREAAADPAARARYETALSRMLERHAPCVVVGRDTWKIVEGAIHVVVEADLETRLRRKYLRESMRASRLQDIDVMEAELRRADLADINLLPGPEVSCVRIANGRRPLARTYDDLLRRIEEQA